MNLKPYLRRQILEMLSCWSESPLMVPKMYLAHPMAKTMECMCMPIRSIRYSNDTIHNILILSLRESFYYSAWYFDAILTLLEAGGRS